jgi:hypothetical protein
MARKPIYQKIQLDGGKEIKDELKGLGEAGEAAFKQIADAAASTQGIGADFGRAMADLRTQIERVGKAGGDLKRSFNDLGGAIGRVGRNVGLAGAAIAGAAAGITAFAKNGADAAAAQDDQAKALGINIREYGRLQFAAEQSGVEQELFARSLTRLNVQLGAAADGNAAAADRFADLGVNIRDASGNLRSTEDILLDLSDAFRRLPAGAERSALAIEFFGRTGGDFLLFLDQGSDLIRRLADDGEQLGAVFTEQQAAVGGLLGEALDRLTRARQALSNQLGLVFAPIVTEAALALSDAIARNRAQIVAFVEQGLARAVPLIRDFINALTGNDAAVESQWVLQARDNIIAFGEAIKAVFFGVVIPAYEALKGAAQLAADAINAFTGGNITAEEILISLAIAKIVGAFGLIAPAIGLVVNAFKLLYLAIGAFPTAVKVITAGIAVIKTAALGLLAPGGALALLVGWPALLVLALAAGVVLLYVYWDEIKAAALDVYNYLVDLFAATGEWIADGFRAGIADIVDLWQRIKDAAAELWADLQTGFGKTWETIERTAQRFVDRLVVQLRRLRDAFRELESRNRERASETTARQQAFASGGYVRGPGSGTSDSILARLSNGEFVIKAAAVRHYGPQLLAALNSMRLPKGRLPGFNMGGLVHGLTAGISGALPRYATGGLVAVPSSGGRPITLNIDGQAISGLTASPAAVEQIERFASSRLIRSTGRRPGWMGA